MIRYSLKRLLVSILLLWAVSLLSFLLLHLIPGDPLVAILGEGADRHDEGRIRRQLGLDQPLWKQYQDFNHRLLNLSLGQSLYYARPVSRVIMAHLPSTLILAMAALTVAILIALPLGFIGGWNPGGKWDGIITVLTSLGMSIPTFLLGLMLILLVAVKMKLLPVSGNGNGSALILPALTLGISAGSLLTRVVRTAIAGEREAPYVLLARAKGVAPRRIIYRHILPNAALPLITMIGLQFGALLSGAVITETIFSRPGIGSLLVDSIRRRDYPTIQGLILFTASLFLLINLLVDLSCWRVQPRTRPRSRKA